MQDGRTTVRERLWSRKKKKLGSGREDEEEQPAMGRGVSLEGWWIGGSEGGRWLPRVMNSAAAPVLWEAPKLAFQRLPDRRPGASPAGTEVTWIPYGTGRNGAAGGWDGAEWQKYRVRTRL